MQCQAESRVIARDDLIRSLLPSVRRIAAATIRRHPARITLGDDIYSAGLLGLAAGVDAIDWSKPGSPRAYVERRISGAILDYLRGEDHLTRHDREHARATGVERWGWPVSIDAPLPADLALNADRSLHDVLPDCRGRSPSDEAERRSELAAVERAARALPARTREVLRQRYSEEIGMVQIGAALGVSEARISQLLREALAKIRAALAPS